MQVGNSQKDSLDNFLAFLCLEKIVQIWRKSQQIPTVQTQKG